ncbi:lipoprotein 17-related variable surface protein [Malacoplasma iowae]|uniref:Lipoprotein 17-related variable surface protein n=1 Tax=Malacoplasma iowae 695 TaxID=1048830 RepID=A0A6P1LD43_MALIO|nr:lipoprotein 17-related variable surface protein [Malacoplasma iowae]QHG89379.1 lipoprotein 17-related variable surface protein [Malacoplasma iowae 695]WPL35909.1 lipoprotein 17-related variable surface protein [Malacoplasma iowae]VEU62745.1 Uncharacterised protein [Mycoplasmopsis fermentans]VEU71525.1 Uncharacterised protein [Malacoplasma iowae]
MVRKIKKVFLFSTTLIIPTISLPYTVFNNNLTNQHIGFDGASQLSESQLLANNVDALKYPVTPDANNNITPYGVFRIVNSDNQKKIVMNDFNSNLLWEYNLLNNDLLRVIYQNYVIKSINTKYNPFMKTIFIYGIVSNDSSAPDKAYLFQLHADTGKPYIVNNSNGNSILRDRDGLTPYIDSLIFDKDEGSFIVFDSSQDYSTFNNMLKISYRNYSTLQINSNDIKKFVQNGTTASNKVINNTKLIKAVNLSNGFFGIYKYYEETTTTTNPTKSTNIIRKVGFAIFDWQLRKLTNDLEVYSENDSTQGVVNLTKSNLYSLINDSFVISKTKNSYLISLNMVEPVMSGNYNNSATHYGFSDKLRFVEFTYPTNGTPINLSLKEINVTNNNYISSLKIDNSTNTIFATTYSDPSKLLTPKLFAVDLSSSKMTEVSNFNNNKNSGSTLVNVFPVDNSLNSDKQKSFLLKQVVNFDNTNNSNVTSNTQITSSKYVGSDVTKSGDTYTENNQNELFTFSINNIQEELTNDQVITKKLPSDVSEQDILGITKLMVNNAENTELLESKTLLPVDSIGNKLVANNAEGKLKVKVELKVKNWWNKTNSFTTLIKEIELTGFSKNSDLEFKLITKSSDDSDKWAAIENLKKALPSAVTTDNIIDSFIKKGAKLNLTKDNVKIYNSESSYLAGETENKIYINVFPDDSNGTLRVSYDLTDISSPSIGQTNLTGSYTYDGFVKTSGWTKVTINDNIFKQFKNKLPYQITKQEIISSLNIGSSYKISPEYWTLTFDDELDSETYIQNMINGQINFTIKYNRQMDSSIPSTVSDENLTVKVTSNTEAGKGFIKLSDYMGENIRLDENLADVKTSSLKLEEVNANINSIIDQTILVTNNWVDPSKIYDVTQKEATDSTVTYNLKLKTEFPSNIYVYDANGTRQNLKITSQWLTKLNEVKPNYFDGVSEIKYNINLTDYDWNYDSINKDNSTISFQNLYEESNAANRGYEYRFLLPSDFINSFETDPIKGKIGFQETFQLIKPYSSASNPIRSLFLNSLSSTRNTDPGYYEIDKVTLIPNNQEGSVIANYVIKYPNLQTAYGNPVLLYPSIKITGMKTQGIASIDNATIITSTIVVLIVISIGLLVFIKIRKNNFLGKNLNNKSESISKNKILISKNNNEEIKNNKKDKENKKVKDIKVDKVDKKEKNKLLKKDKPKDVKKKNVNQAIDFSKLE